MSFITNIDFTILDYIHDHLSCGALDFLMPKITFLGNAGLIWIIIAVCMLISRKYRQNGIALTGGLIGCVVIGNLLLKNLVARARPCWINDTVNMLISVPTDYSFPSVTPCPPLRQRQLSCRRTKSGALPHIFWLLSLLFQDYICMCIFPRIS